MGKSGWRFHIAQGVTCAAGWERKVLDPDRTAQCLIVRYSEDGECAGSQTWKAQVSRKLLSLCAELCWRAGSCGALTAARSWPLTAVIGKPNADACAPDQSCSFQSAALGGAGGYC